MLVRLRNRWRRGRKCVCREMRIVAYPGGPEIGPRGYFDMPGHHPECERQYVSWYRRALRNGRAMFTAYGDWLTYAAWKLHLRLQRFAYERLCDRLEDVCLDEQRLQKVLAVSAPEHHKRWLANWAKTLREFD